NALYELAAAVGGDKAAVSVIIPDGTEPHDFEPKARDLAVLENADIFIVNGLGMDDWADDAVKAAGNTDIVVVDASAGVDAISIEEHEGENEAEHGAYDPHIWLSPLCAVTMAGNIRNALIKADPRNSTYYEANYNTFSGALEKLYTEYAEKFKNTVDKSFVTGHAAFAYLCRDFGLVQKSVENVFAEGEPGAQQLAALVDYCRENRITTIFTETLVSAAVSETLAREVGAVVKPIYTMAGTENGKSYLERMEENLRVIYESLK
ncbi:MAG: zinc ABC transporter solute-binding protein, partial [Clostridiales bacterium]|nr:zinc ABC transporter solute-binding protein [Clostridiales bacterium]